MLPLKKKPENISPGKIAWRKFRNNKSAIIALSWIILCTITAISGYLITPDSTPLANTQHLELAALRPGSEISFLRVRKNADVEQKNFLKKMLSGQTDQYIHVPIDDFTFQETYIVIEKHTGDDDFEGMEMSYSLADVVLPLDSAVLRNNEMITTDIFGEIRHFSIDELQSIIKNEHIISKTFYLGTDRFGRDMLSQMIIGARISLSVGFIAITIALLLGVLLGSVAGFFRGPTDSFIVWLINVVWSIPTLLLVIAITFALGKGFWQIFVAVGLTMWVDVARVVRGQIISLRENEYIEAARALGLPGYHIITRHLLPNITGPVVVISAANFASAILIEAGLSFLGIGVQPPMPSWGNMIRENYGFIILDKAYLAIIPGLGIMLLVMAFMLTGNGLRDALDKSAANY